MLLRWKAAAHTNASCGNDEFSAAAAARGSRAATALERADRCGFLHWPAAAFGVASASPLSHCRLRAEGLFDHGSDWNWKRGCTGVKCDGATFSTVAIRGRSLAVTP